MNATRDADEYAVHLNNTHSEVTYQHAAADAHHAWNLFVMGEKLLIILHVHYADASYAVQNIAHRLSRIQKQQV